MLIDLLLYTMNTFQLLQLNEVLVVGISTQKVQCFQFITFRST